MQNVAKMLPQGVLKKVYKIYNEQWRIKLELLLTSCTVNFLMVLSLVSVLSVKWIFIL